MNPEWTLREQIQVARDQIGMIQAAVQRAGDWQPVQACRCQELAANASIDSALLAALTGRPVSLEGSILTHLERARDGRS